MKRIRMIYNPSSGDQNQYENLMRLCTLLISDGYEVSLFRTEAKGDAAKECMLNAHKYDIIVSVGGDGTINEVANGVLLSRSNTPVAILSSGTVNDFASYLGIPREAEAFFQVIKNHDVLEVDVGKLNDNYFINVVACGLFANVGHDVEKGLKAKLGKFAYYLNGIKSVTKEGPKPFKIKLESDEKTIEEDVFLVIIANTSSVGGFKNLAPEASVTDGYLNVICIRATNIAEYVNIFMSIFSGTHVDSEYVYYFTTNQLQIDSDEKIEIDYDGEDGGILPCTISVAKEKLRVLI